MENSKKLETPFYTEGDPSVEIELNEPVNPYKELVCLGSLPFKVGSKFGTELREFPEFIPEYESKYAPPPMNYTAANESVKKYFNMPHTYFTVDEFCSQFAEKFMPEYTGKQVYHELMCRLDEVYKNLALYMKPLDDELVYHYLTHDLGGSLRHDSSLGIGYGIRRKEFARKHRDFIMKFLQEMPMWPVYWWTFLKDELRELLKEARSISVPQIHLWLIVMKILGGFYHWHQDTCVEEWSHHAFGIGVDSPSWTILLQYFKSTEPVHCYDLKKQDSKMAHAIVMLMHSFLQSKTPSSSWSYIDYIFDESFTNKKVVTPDGNVYTFSDGEMSGNPLTILFNTFHNTILFTLTEMVSGECFPKRVLGDDSIFQTKHAALYAQICAFAGHECYEQSNHLINDAVFLSWKFNNYGYFLEPYYGNVDKMIASLHYTTGGLNEFLEKVNSYRLMLAAAPMGSVEDYWYNKLDSYLIEKLLKDPRVDKSRFSYLPRAQLLEERRCFY